jgi:putative alpha-1,2-mannosidase
MAWALGRADDAREFERRAAFYRRVLDPETGFARPRLADGEFASPFDPSVSTRWTRPGPNYVLGPPLFARATLDLGDGRRLVVRAENVSAENKYVQSATLGGKPLVRAWLRHDELVTAGELAFVMGPRPSRAWGAAEADRPPSMSDGFPR